MGIPITGKGCFKTVLFIITGIPYLKWGPDVHKCITPGNSNIFHVSSSLNNKLSLLKVPRDIVRYFKTTEPQPFASTFPVSNRSSPQGARSSMGTDWEITRGVLSSIFNGHYMWNTVSLISLHIFKMANQISHIIPCSLLIFVSDWLITVKYGAVSHVWRHQREI